MELLWLPNSESPQFFLLTQDFTIANTDVVIVVVLFVFVMLFKVRTYRHTSLGSGPSGRIYVLWAGGALFPGRIYVLGRKRVNVVGYSVV